MSFASSAPEPLDESLEIMQENNEQFSRLDIYERDPNVSVQPVFNTNTVNPRLEVDLVLF